MTEVRGARCDQLWERRWRMRVQVPQARPPVRPPAKPMMRLAGMGICFDSAAQIGRAITPKTTPRRAFLVMGPIMRRSLCTERAIGAVQGFCGLDVQSCAHQARQL